MRSATIYFRSFLFLALIVVYTNITAQNNNQWVWLRGSNTPNSLGSYGLQGFASATNAPPPRYEASEWTDNQGRFWLFGGYETVNNNSYSDMWMYDPATNMWTWMSGPSTANTAPSWGTQGVASPSNNPGPRRYGCATWTDNNGNLWMFGGFSMFASVMNDLWKYDITTNQWTWMKGPSSPSPGVYGTMGVEAPNNFPNYRCETSATWVDANNCLWMFGGEGNGLYNDLWRFNIATNNWTWMGGSQWSYGAGIYGTQGVGSSANIPGARRVYASWKDAAGNFWLFGGNDTSAFLGGGSRNDLWKYEPANGNWTWVSGSNLINQPAVYGTQCVPSVNNIPGARLETRSRWTDDCGNFWLFGGSWNPAGVYMYNDLWKYNPSTNEWTYVSGTTLNNGPGVYGTQGVPAAANKPPARSGANAWKSAQGLYLFGGNYFANGGTGEYYNDLWKYIPDKPTAQFALSPGSGCAALTVNFTDQSLINCTDIKSWLWKFGDGNTSALQNPSNTYYNPGTYTVTLVVTSCLGIKDSTTHTVSVTPGITVNGFSVDASCGGNNGFAWAVPANGTSPFTYSWSTGATNDSIYNLAAGTYTATVTDNGGCSDTAVVTINSSGTVSTSAISGPTPVCPNTNGLIYTVVNTPGSTYSWTVPAGAAIVSGQGTNSIVVNWGAAGGVITVTETASCGTGAPVNYNVTIGTNPNTGAISGTSPVCPNAANVVYTVNNTAGSTYAWTVPAGATIVSGQGTNSIIVNWGSTGGNISVTETTNCGTGTAVLYPVTVFPLPSTSPITGGNPTCANATGITYSVTNTPGNTYVWTVPAGATIVSGQGTNAIVVNWGSTGGTITCTESNACGSGTPVSMNVSFSSVPVTSSITGVSPVCPSQAGTIYTVANNPGSTYTWTVPAGAFIASGQGSNTIVVNWGTNGGVVTCIESNMCGNGTVQTFTVVMNALPNTGPISGPTPLCMNTTAQTYSVAATSGSTYTWSVPAGATIVTGQGSNSISVTWGTSGGTISVTESNACGTGTAVTYSVTILPAPQVNFSGDTLSGCAPLTVNFSDLTVASTGTITSWQWVFGDGNTSTQQNPSNTYSGSGGYNVSLTVTNNYGCSATYSAVNYVNVYPNPDAAFTSNSGSVSISDPTVIFTDQSTANIVSWSWDFGDGTTSAAQDPTHVYGDAGSWITTLTVTNQYGCVDVTTQAIEVKDEFTFYIPNAFTPDGDNLNDYFRGEGRGIEKYHLEIYDRWGERIFESDDWNEPWRGTTKRSDKLVQIDVYVYKIRVGDIFGINHDYVGHVSVVR